MLIGDNRQPEAMASLYASVAEVKLAQGKDREVPRRTTRRRSPPTPGTRRR